VSVPPIPLQREFPYLVGHMEGILSRVWPSFQARVAWRLNTYWLAVLIYITISNLSNLDDCQENIHLLRIPNILDENAVTHSLLIRSKNVRREVSLLFNFKWTLLYDKY
jgi:hypothetical protein